MISILMLAVFSVLILKHLLPYSTETAHEDCNQIGHIHTFHRHFMNINAFRDPHRQADEQTGDEECHSSNSIFSYSLFPTVIYEVYEPTYEVAFDLVSVIDNNFQSPAPEPIRKPPKNF